MTPPPLNEVFKLAPGPVPVLMFVRVALAVGLPMIGFTLAGQPLAAVAAGATAMFVTLCDVGRNTPSRASMMLLGIAAILLGGVAGDKFGGSTGIDEALVIASAFVAAWVSNSQPGLAVVARYGAVAVAAAAGVGMQISNPLAAGAVVAGGLWSLTVGLMVGWLAGLPAAQANMDWRAGLRRALAGADAEPRFAIVVALMAALALFAATHLGVTRAYWATLTVILVMRREGMVSLKLTLQYLAGTLIGIPLATLLWHAAGGTQWLIALLATLAAASSRLGMALNPALGFACMTSFMVLAVDLLRIFTDGPVPLVLGRLTDVALGGALAVAGTLIAGAWHRRAQAKG
jgi:Fusaric acid resistance protein-like